MLQSKPFNSALNGPNTSNMITTILPAPPTPPLPTHTLYRLTPSTGAWTGLSCHVLCCFVFWTKQRKVAVRALLGFKGKTKTTSGNTDFSRSAQAHTIEGTHSRMQEVLSQSQRSSLKSRMSTNL